MTTLAQNALSGVTALQQSLFMPLHVKEWWMSVGKGPNERYPFTVAGYPNNDFNMEVASGNTPEEAVTKFLEKAMTPAKLRAEAAKLISKAQEMEGAN